MTPSELTKKITVENEKNSQVVILTVQDSNANTAANIANKTAEVFKEEIVKIMSVNNVSILAKASADDNPSPIKPKPLLNVAFAAIVGLIVAVGLAILFEYLDNTVKNEQEIEKLLGLPVLGVIATMDNSQKKENRASRSERTPKLRGETIGS
jgi:capsular polysaccharide biosynthesis protein